MITRDNQTAGPRAGSFGARGALGVPGGDAHILILNIPKPVVTRVTKSKIGESNLS